MSSFTTIVGINEETPSKLAYFISELLPSGGIDFFNECKSLIESKDTQALISKLLESQEFILSQENESGIFKLIEYIINNFLTKIFTLRC